MMESGGGGVWVPSVIIVVNLVFRKWAFVCLYMCL
jgi:hypothetical protein